MWTYITVFCLGAIVGMTYTYAVYLIADTQAQEKKTMKQFEYYSFFGSDFDEIDQSLEEINTLK